MNNYEMKLYLCVFMSDFDEEGTSLKSNISVSWYDTGSGNARSPLFWAHVAGLNKWAHVFIDDWEELRASLGSSGSSFELIVIKLSRLSFSSDRDFRKLLGVSMYTVGSYTELQNRTDCSDLRLDDLDFGAELSDFMIDLDLNGCISMPLMLPIFCGF